MSQVLVVVIALWCVWNAIALRRALRDLHDQLNALDEDRDETDE